MAKDYMTHKELESMCDEFMAGQDWIRQVFVGNQHPVFDKANWSHLLPTLPDRIYEKNSEILFIEIKPGNCSNLELKKALGQMMCLYPYNVKAYLLLSLKQWETLEVILKIFPWIGVLVYNPKPKVGEWRARIAQKAAEKSGIELTRFPISIKPKWGPSWILDTSPLKRKWNRKAKMEEGSSDSAVP